MAKRTKKVKKTSEEIKVIRPTVNTKIQRIEFLDPKQVKVIDSPKIARVKQNKPAIIQVFSTKKGKQYSGPTCAFPTCNKPAVKSKWCSQRCFKKATAR